MSERDRDRKSVCREGKRDRESVCRERERKNRDREGACI